jgi:hypothetical protein
MCLLLQSLPRCNQSQTSVQKESLRKLFCMIDCNNEDSISKFEIQQFIEKMIYTLIVTKICPAEDIDTMCEYMAESVTELTNNIFDGKLNLEDVFEGLKYQVGIRLCHLTRFSKCIKFQDQPCGYPCGFIVDQQTRNVLDIEGGVACIRNPVILFPEHGGANQKLEEVPFHGNWMKLRNPESGLCLQVSNNGQDLTVNEGGIHILLFFYFHIFKLAPLKTKILFCYTVPYLL